MRKPYLIQRCKTNKFDPDLNTGQYLTLDYMGSSEFEWGAIPKFQRDIFEKIHSMNYASVNHNGMTLFFFCDSYDDVNEYCQYLKDIMDHNIRLKERARLDDKEVLYVGKKQTALHDAPHAPYKYDVWFDLTNTTIIARSVEALDNLRKTIGNSIRYMDAQKR